MPGILSDANSEELVLRSALRFLRRRGFAFLAISALLLLPCFWHARIQAGDLGSHVYNAWLAQLVERREVSGVAVVGQWNNILFDQLLFHTANAFGFAVAEKLVVSGVVLVFFWGSFAFLSEFSGRNPWLLIPLIAVASYGYSFHMGFMNFYLSIGLALFGIVGGLRRGAGNWVTGGMLAGLALLAHPIGFLFLCGTVAYVRVGAGVKRRFRWVLPIATLAGFVLLRLYFGSHPDFEADWRSEGILSNLGNDQLNLFGERYRALSVTALIWALLCAAAGWYEAQFRRRDPAKSISIVLELYLVTIVVLALLPENLRFDLYSGWVGLLVSRLTLVSALFGLTILSCLRLPRWTSYGFFTITVVFFAMVFQDTGKLDRMEANARRLTASMKAGTRVVVVANAPEQWRAGFIYHSLERACIGHCFSVANYEPSSGQFRVRALPGSRTVTDSSEKSEAMSSGDYVVQPADLPLTSIYQCDDADFTVLCAVPLQAGQKTEDPETPPLGQLEPAANPPN